MTTIGPLLADGEAGRAATVGWIILIVVVGVGVLIAIVAAVATGENIMERLEGIIPKFSGRWWLFLVVGLAMLALGYIVGSGGIAILGGAVLFVAWRLSEVV